LISFPYNKIVFIKEILKKNLKKLSIFPKDMFSTFLFTPACGRQGTGRWLIDILGKKGKVRTENGKRRTEVNFGE
jgi:hypothetical protein